ncbi:hypothetical protein [Nonomuraea bangladeshensis]|uniref:hypothetical protein n=1 Tax=Nonomuraea bangladeshensis TaxID=404385 RepID=UPI0031D3C742
MPNNNVFRRPFRRRGQNWLPPTRPALADVIGAGGVVVGGAATILESIEVGTAVGAGGAVVSGAAEVYYAHQIGSQIGAGGVEVGGTGSPQFVHAGQVPSDIVVEWDLDNDGDFSAPVEDITPYVLSAETFTGRDWPSLLTGRAGPGKLRASLRNDDDRFNYFNASSPLVTAPYSLKTGRKVRVRTTAATTPDPALLARDRFRRADGALDEDETGLTYVQPLSDDFAIATNRAVATGEGDPHIAVLDVGAADYYVQARIGVTGAISNRVGLIYRYVDSDDYSLCVVDLAAGGVYLLDVAAGVESVAAARTSDVYGGVTLGVLVEGSTATLYLDGVPMLSATAPNTSAEQVGIYAAWATGDARPELDDLYVWDGLPSQVEGVLWTGDIAELVSSVQAGPEKVATISGEGWLSKLATQKVTPPVSIEGRRTGPLMGNVLASAGLLHPPGSIAEGDVTTGTVAISESTAIDAARSFEETEYGFLYEMQEGPLAFRARSARDGSSSQVLFTDAPDGKFGYHRLEPYDWRREVFNRIVAGVSPWTEGAATSLYTDPGPYILTTGQTATIRASSTGLVSRWTGHTRDVKIPAAPTGVSVTTQASTSSGTFNVNLPATVNDGDLLLILVGNSLQAANWDGSAPSGWSVIGKTSTFGVVAKVGESSDSGGTASFSSVNAHWAAHVYRVTGWYGSLAGVQVSEFTSASAQPDPPSISPSWGPVSTLYIAAWKTWNGFATQTGVPSGYANGASITNTNGNGVSMGSARRIAAVSVEDPASFTTSPAAGPVTVTIAVRGGVTTTQVTGSDPSGDDGTFTISYNAAVGGGTQSHENIQVSGVPLVQGDQQLVQADDYASQDEHNAIRTYTNPANLFATAADAMAYAELVLATHADDRPILSMSFYASKSPAYRKQAYTRRVGDRITLVANHNTGFGISRDFFIESISHRWSHGTRLWETTWELSPAE